MRRQKFDDSKRHRIELAKKNADVRKILTDLQIPFKERRCGDIWFECLYGKHEHTFNSTHIEANRTKAKCGLWKCFGCDINGDILDLILKGSNLEFSEALLWLEARQIDPMAEFVSPLDKPIRNIKLPPKFESPDTIDDWDTDYLNYLQGRGITWYQIKHFGIGYCDRGKYRNRVIIPVYLKHQLRTWIGRNITSKGSRITSCSNGLVGIFGSQHMNPDNGPAIIVEGWADALHLDRLGYANVGSAQTNKLIDDQMDFLEQFTTIIVMPDGDEGGDNFVNSLTPYLHRSRFFIAMIPRGKDPDNCTPEEIRFSMNNIDRWAPVVRRREIEIEY